MYEAILIVSFGGPENRDEVMPFLENVVRGRRIPRERLLEVAEHYYHLGGRSPINQHVRDLAAALRDCLAEKGPALPVYIGNRNWHPLLPDSIRQMQQDGVRRALAFVTSAFSSYSGCRQYLENIRDARRQVGDAAPEIHKLRNFFNHPGFLEPMAANIREALSPLPAGAEILFTAHSLPVSMAKTSRYQEELQEACKRTADMCGNPPWRLVYQSRSGPPSQPWLDPDVLDALRNLAGKIPGVAIAPIGFLSDHVEVLWDLDEEAAALCRELNLPMRRAATVGAHPQFVEMIRTLVLERTNPAAPRLSLGTLPLCPDVCPDDCCPAPT
ncbi:MAG: ferrochelatase [Acidimicrobiia bacterium]|nr:ferrochelatase [Acidimicrobiia bacterium]